MPGPMTIPRGNQLFDTVIIPNGAATLTPPASVPVSTVTAATYTIPGLQLLDLITVNPQANYTNLSINYAYVSAANTLTVLWANETGSTVTSAPAWSVVIEVIRCENANLGLTLLPQSIS